MEDMVIPTSGKAVAWQDDPRNLGRFSPREVMLRAYGAEAVKAMEQSNAAAEQASDFITTYVVGR